jgi:hypothetical protein
MQTPGPGASSPVRLSIAVSWTGLWDSGFPPVFPVDGSLLAAPPFPLAGPGRPGSPPSSVVRRRYDFPRRRSRSLMTSVSGSMRFSVFVLAEALPARRRTASGPGGLWSAGLSPYPAGCAWTGAGSLRFPGNPSHTFARLSDPGRTEGTSPLAVPPVLPPDPTRRRLQRNMISRLNPGLRYPLPTLHERHCHRPCKARFRLAGCAFAGRASNPLDRYERFRVTSVLLSRTFLTQAGSICGVGSSSSMRRHSRRLRLRFWPVLPRSMRSRRRSAASLPSIDSASAGNEANRSSRRCMNGCTPISVECREHPIWRSRCATRSVTGQV